MRERALAVCALMSILLLAVPTADAQVRAEGRVNLEFLEDDVTVRSGENLTVPLHVLAEIECDGAHSPPSRVAFSGRYGVSLITAEGAYYSTQVDPPTVPFERVESTVTQTIGPVLYKVDLEVSLRIDTEVPVDEPIEKRVVYSTVGFSSMEGCTASGWNLPSAEDAAFDLHVLRAPTGAHGQAQENAGADGALVVVLAMAIAVASLRRRP